MNNSRKNRIFPLVVILLLCSISLMPAIAAPTFANTPFQNLWQYSDKLVDEIPGAGRGFTWGQIPLAYFRKIIRREQSANDRFNTSIKVAWNYPQMGNL